MSAYNKDIFRTLKGGWRRFLAIAVITTLGVTMFSGLQASCRDLRVEADSFFDSQNLHDLKIQSTLGMTDDDVQALKDMEDVESAAGIYSADLIVHTSDNAALDLSYQTIADDGSDAPYIVEGVMPSESGQCAVTKDLADKYGLAVGDTLDVEKGDGDSVTVPDAFVISALIVDPTKVGSTSGAVSYRNSSVDKDCLYILPEDADQDVYSAVLVRMRDSDSYFTYDRQYLTAVSDLESQIRSGVQEAREDARWQQVKSEAYDALAEETEPARSELSDAREQLAYARKEADQQFADAQAQIDDGLAETADNEKTLQDKEQEVESSASSLAAQKEQVQTQEDSLNQQKADLQAQLDSLNQQKTDLQVQLDSLNQQKADLQVQLDSLNQQKADLQAQAESLNEQKKDLQAQSDNLNAQESALQAETDIPAEQQANQIRQIDAALSQITAGISQIDANLPQLTGGISQIDANLPQLTDGIGQLESGISQLNSAVSQIDDGLASLSAARQQIEDGGNQIETGRAQIADGYDQIRQAKAELADAQNELDEQKAAAEVKFSESEQEIADGEAELEKQVQDAGDDIEAIGRPSWYIQSRSALSGYSNVQSDADSIESIGKVFPVLFLAVAILISLTAITRMVEEDRGILGTYRALGFTNREIRRKYMTFAALSAITGSLVGSAGAFIILPRFLFWVFSNMYLFPGYSFSFLPAEGLFGPALFIAAVVLAAWAVCRKELKQTPAELMRPKAPPAGKRIFLEYIPFIWKRMPFLSKVTARNLFRYGKRFLMTVVGISGCMALLLFGFAVQDSVTDMLPKQYGGVFRYDCLAAASSYDTLESYIEEAKAAGEIDKEQSLYVTSVSVKNEAGDEMSAQLYVVPNASALDGMICLTGMDGNDVTLEDGKTLITANAADILGIAPGETFEAGTADMPSVTMTLDGVVKNYLGNYIYMTKNTFEQYFKEYEPNAEMLIFTDSVTDQTAWCRTLAEKEDITACVSTEEVKSEFHKSFELVNMVVYVVIIMSAALAVVVLYTLETTNISERERELATIKVLGFFDREVSLYVNKEVIILTLFGIAAGIPLGRAFAQTLNTVLKLPAISLEAALHPSSYLISAALVFVFALLVQLVTDKILRRIDPVTALKSAE